jgi:hypothetical protein
VEEVGSVRIRQGSPGSRRVIAASTGGLMVALGVLVFFVFFRPAPAEPSAGPVVPMDPALAAGLAKQGVFLEDTSGGGAIPAAEAVNNARVAMPLVADVAPTESLVLFTDEAYGPEDASGRVQPVYVKRLAWAVVFTRVKVPIMGGVGMDGDMYAADMVVFIDAATGAFLNAIALPAS